MLQVRIGGHKYREARLLCRGQSLAVLQFRPFTLVGGGHLVWREEPAQGDGCTLIEENTHLLTSPLFGLHLYTGSTCGRLHSVALIADRTVCGGRGTLCGVFEYGADLLRGNAREPLHELRYLRAILQILKQRGNRHARTAEDPCSADAIGMTFHGRARRPVDHDLILSRTPFDGQAAGAHPLIPNAATI